MKGRERTGRIAEIVARAAAEFIERAASTESLITIVRAEASKRGDHITLYVSVFPDDKTVSALAFLNRQREAFSDHLKKHARIHTLPRVDFLQDDRRGMGEVPPV